MQKFDLKTFISKIDFKKKTISKTGFQKTDFNKSISQSCFEKNQFQNIDFKNSISKNRFQVIELIKSISKNGFQKIDFRQSISKTRFQKISKSVYGSRRCELGCSAFRRFRHESVPDSMAHPSAHLVGPWAPAATERVATLINWHLDRFGISFAMLVSASAMFWSQCRHKK